MNLPKRPGPGGRRFLTWLAIGTASLAALVAGLLFLQLRQLEDLRASMLLRADSFTALSFQFEREFLRFRHTLDLHIHASDQADEEELRLRYDIFASRKVLLEENPSTVLLRKRSEYLETMPKMAGFFQEADRIFAGETLKRDELLRILDLLQTLGPEIQALSLAANNEMTLLVDAKQKTIRHQNETIVGLTAAQLVVLLMAAAALVVRNKRQMQEREQLEALTHNLREAHKQAEEANQGKTRFLANMSHELRTPFNGMLGMLAMLETTPLNEVQRDYTRTASESAQHLLTLLNDILDVSAMEAGKMKLKPEPMPLRQVLKDVEALMCGQANAKGLRLTFSLATNLPDWVQADPTRIKQIVFNLLSNAIKFTSQGQVALTAAVAAGPADRVAQIVIQVEDTGIGMDADTLQMLFQRFYQVESSTSRRFGGTGLGLEISRTLARMMGGDLAADSTPGKGSRFTLTVPLPLCEAPPAPQGTRCEALPRAETNPLAEASPSASDGQDKPDGDPAITARPRWHVLVAEDHPVNRKLMAALLTKAGHQATFCENGQEAVEAIATRHFDLIFMDMHMPVMDGLTATRLIREQHPNPAGLPIVALTADVMNEAKEKALDAGVNEFLAKPIHLPALHACMQRWLGQ